VNFGLRVRGRRGDGYHELESVFLPLDLADDLELEIEEGAAPEVGLTLESGDAGVPAGAENLAALAARGFLEAAGLRARVGVRLRKRIPSGAGLGGGSSDAAAVLRGLATRFSGALAPAALERLALALGADVPFFLDPRPALVTGVGERREPRAGWPAFHLLLASPGMPLATARVFAAYDAAPAPPPPEPLRPLVLALRRNPGDPAALAALLANDLEPAARRLEPGLVALREALAASGARAVGMSGSGATLFGVFADAGAARAARGRLPGGTWARVARTRESG
jgi:4-diphosphocytidyl-2-C-methyl-D-erythritol kinase